MSEPPAFEIRKTYAVTVGFMLVMFMVASAVQSGTPNLLMVIGCLLVLPAALLWTLHLVGARSARRRADARMGRADALAFGSADEILKAGGRERNLRIVVRCAWGVTGVLFVSMFFLQRIELLAASIFVGMVSVFFGLVLVGRCRVYSIALRRYTDERDSMVCPRCFYDLFADSSDKERARCPECGGSFSIGVLRDEWSSRARVASRPFRYRLMHAPEPED